MGCEADHRAAVVGAGPWRQWADVFRVPGDRGGDRDHHRGAGDHGHRYGREDRNPQQDHGDRRSLNERVRRDDGQTLGIYIVAVGALFFLAFAFFAVGQASVTRNGAQTAADAAALAAARGARDGIETDFLNALKAGDIAKLKGLLNGTGIDGLGACAAAGTYAAGNDAEVTACPGTNVPLSYTVGIRTLGTVGKSVVNGTEGIHATSKATAVITPRCTDGRKGPNAIIFTCNSGELTVDPTASNFKLNLAEFFSVHLSE
jgi:Flp pilus assembly protein TadG